MRIQRVIAHQIYLIRHDDVILSRLASRTNMAALAALFEFSQAAVAQDESGAPVVNLQVGLFRGEGMETPIVRLAIEDRRILIDVDGPTQVADAAYEALRSHLRSALDRQDDAFLQPIVKAEESELIANLDFPAEALVSPHLAQLAAESLTASTSYPFAPSSAKLGQVSFVIQYEPQGLALDDYRISLLRKEFIIGLRPGFPPQDRIYYSKAPVSTQVHSALLEHIERLLQREMGPA